MSLINDALKRAKQAQQPNSPDAPQMRVQFRPVEPSQQVRRSNTGIWVAVILVAGSIVAFVAHQVTRGNSPSPKEAKAREVVTAKPTPRESAPPPPVAPPMTTTTAPAATTAITSPVRNPAQAPVVKEASTNIPVGVQEDPLPKLTPKLQAVVYQPKRPSAIISGKSVFVGDRVGDFHVSRITQESVTLVSGGQTNVLVLGE